MNMKTDCSKLEAYLKWINFQFLASVKRVRLRLAMASMNQTENIITWSSIIYYNNNLMFCIFLQPVFKKARNLSESNDATCFHMKLTWIFFCAKKLDYLLLSLLAIFGDVDTLIWGWSTWYICNPICSMHVMQVFNFKSIFALKKDRKVIITVLLTEQ